MKPLKLSLFLVLLAFAARGYAQAPVNIFETFESGVLPAGWHITGFFIHDAMNHTPGGTYCARSSQGAPPQNNFLRSPKFSVVAGERMNISFVALRTGNGVNPWANVRIKGATLDYSFDTVVISNTSWQLFRFTIDPIPVNDSVYIYFYCNTNPGSQRALFDDISIFKSVILPGFPSEPSGLAAVATSGTTIDLSWIDNSSNESKFMIERKIEGDPTWNLVDSVAENTVLYSDSQLNSGTIYHYRVYAKNSYGNSPYSNIAFDTTFTVTGLIGNSSIPDRYNLYTNYPNPFNPSTKIKFDIPAASYAKLIIFDMVGREVNTKIYDNLTPGTYEYEFNAGNLSSGVYFYRLISNEFIETKRMVLIK